MNEGENEGCLSYLLNSYASTIRGFLKVTFGGGVKILAGWQNVIRHRCENIGTVLRLITASALYIAGLVVICGLFSLFFGQCEGRSRDADSREEQTLQTIDELREKAQGMADSRDLLDSYYSELFGDPYDLQSARIGCTNSILDVRQSDFSRCTQMDKTFVVVIIAAVFAAAGATFSLLNFLGVSPKKKDETPKAKTE